MRELSPDEAAGFIASEGFVWHQRFELAPGVWTPGANDVGQLLDAAAVPVDLTGRRALDVGTANGGVAFELERRGADVVAVDVAPPDLYGFDRLHERLGSTATFVRASLYDLRTKVDGHFDVVVCFGVLYHLRHPLLGLDQLRTLVADGGRAWLETALADCRLGPRSHLPLAEFFRWGELGDDPSNWFAPTAAALDGWCRSAGFRVERLVTWPERRPERGLVELRPRPGPPEYRLGSYEVPLAVTLLDEPPRWDAATFDVPAAPPE